MVSVADLITDADILAQDPTLLEIFGPARLAARLPEKRAEAHAWTVRGVTHSGRNARLWNLARKPDSVLYLRGTAVSSDVTDLLSTRAAGVDLGTMIASPGLDNFLVGLRWPFRGIRAQMFTDVNTTSLALLDLTYWNGGAWVSPTSLTDGTRDGLMSFARGGYIHWRPADDWQTRPGISSITASSWMYYTRITVTTLTSTPTRVYELLPVRRSALTDAAVNRALQMLYLSNAVGDRGKWMEQADRFGAMAKDALTAGLTQLDDEIDADDDGKVTPVEVASVAPTRDYANLNTWERG